MPAYNLAAEHTQPATAFSFTFAHPRANRRAILDSCLVHYEFRRSKRRTIGLAIGAEGLVVSAPYWVALQQIEDFIFQKSRWIVEKLTAQHEHTQQAQLQPQAWQLCSALPVLGQSTTVDQLGLALTPEASSQAIGQALQQWLKTQAQALFIERLNHFAPLLGVHWTKLTLSQARTRWGSAHSNGSICLNWRLMHLDPQLIDYVVVHELSHLRVMDHSPKFWSVVGSVLPDYAALRRALRQAGAVQHLPVFI